MRTATATPHTIGVLICSYRRPDSLLRGLAALAVQERVPDEVVVVVRDEDAATQDALAARPADVLRVRRVVVSRPGTVHALNSGLAASGSDVVAITDDDTAPRPDWTARILAHFQADPSLGGLGGRDWMHENGTVNDGSADQVGRLQWFGRTIGNHHLGVGGIRPVDMLKGANMSYRREATAGLGFDRRLRGTGAQPAEDVAFSTSVKHAGWRLCYDPLVAVDHYTGSRDEPRHYSGIVRTVDAAGLRNFAHNEVVSLWSSLRTPSRRAVYFAWSVLVGTKVSPGLLQAVLMTRRLGLVSWRRFGHIQRGKLAGLRTMTARPRADDTALGKPAVPG